MRTEIELDWILVEKPGGVLEVLEAAGGKLRVAQGTKEIMILRTAIITELSGLMCPKKPRLFDARRPRLYLSPGPQVREFPWGPAVLAAGAHHWQLVPGAQL